MTTYAQDEEHLRLLSIFHYILGGLGVLFALFPLVHAGVGWMLVFSPETFGPSGAGEQPPAAFGWLFFGMGLMLFILGQALAICTILAGRRITQRRGYWFVFVVDCCLCMMFPFGTALGVFGIIVLSRPSVKQAFGLPMPSPPPLRT